uniref:HTH CENPB-type domain-containing protein n=1 Tax=Ascaris lumbricoides TaxID=6252 RepID=A0A0M3HR12_ASCLU
MNCATFLHSASSKWVSRWRKHNRTAHKLAIEFSRGRTSIDTFRASAHYQPYSALKYFWKPVYRRPSYRYQAVSRESRYNNFISDVSVHNYLNMELSFTSRIVQVLIRQYWHDRCDSVRSSDLASDG